jgi:hypothetical protein
MAIARALLIAHSGSACAPDRLVSGAARRLVARSPLRPQTTPDPPLRAVRQARDERTVARPSVPFQSRSSSRTMTAMMSATIAMVRVFMRTSPSFCGHPYRRPGSRSIATMPDARADRAPIVGSYRHFVVELVETALHRASGAGAPLPFAHSDSRPFHAPMLIRKRALASWVTAIAPAARRPVRG